MNYPKLIISILICQAAGFIGAIFTSTGAWYTALQKPWFNPPNWVFGPVWTTIYLLMGISLYLVWSKKAKRHYYYIFGLQLALNTAWSFLFFGLKSPFYAFMEIILLWIAILATIIYFMRISKTAAYLLFPYILWVSFAALLNYSMWMLNV